MTIHEKTRYEKMSDIQLLKEYRESLKHGFNDVFGHSAREETNEIVDILYSRGITSYVDIFGKREVKKWRY